MSIDIKERAGKESINRRKFLQALGATGTVGLAGCGQGGSGATGDGNENNDGGDGDVEHGERIPPLVFQWWTGPGGGTNVYSDMLETMMPEWEDLGFTIDPEPIQYTAQTEEMGKGSMARDGNLWFHSANPDRLDPHFTLVRYGIDRAGNTGTENPADYASCEFTDLAKKQATFADPEKRKEVVWDAVEVRSHDRWAAQLFPMNQIGAYRTDYVELDGVGDAGIYWTNPAAWFKSKPLKGDLIAVHSWSLDTANYWIYPEVGNVLSLHQGVSTPLVAYNEFFELENLGAENIEISEDNLRYTFDIKEHYWQNGDQVTAHDWEFTLKMIDNNIDQVGQAIKIPYEDDGITALDDTTLEVQMKEPYAPFLTRDLALYSVVHRDTWEPAGAMENLGENAPDWPDMIGCGPYKISAFSQGDLLELSPREDGREALKWNPQHNIRFRDYDDAEAIFRDFEAGNVHMWNNTSPANKERVETDNQLSQKAEVVVKPTFTPWILYYHNGSGSMKHREVREAIGMSMNRKRVADIVHRGLVEPDPVATNFPRNHPWRAPDEKIYKYTDDITGDVEGARKLLEDAGFTWDDGGNIRLPSDRNLEPLWEDGGRPTAEDFECMTEDGEYIPASER